MRRELRGRYRGQSRRPGLSVRLAALGAIAHFDPASGATDDGTTSTWTDLIGGYVLTSTSQATRLVYSASLAGLNGRPGWTGTAANSTRIVAGDGVLAGLLSGSQAFSAYHVRKWASGVGIVWSCGSTANGQVHHVGATTSGQHISQRYDGGSTSHTGTVTGSNLMVDSVVYSGSTMAAWSNGTETLAAAANTRAPTVNRFSVGGRIVAGAWDSFWDGLIGDVAVFTDAHSAATRQTVENMLMSHYSL